MAFEDVLRGSMGLLGLGGLGSGGGGDVTVQSVNVSQTAIQKQGAESTTEEPEKQLLLLGALALAGFLVVLVLRR